MTPVVHIFEILFLALRSEALQFMSGHKTCIQYTLTSSEHILIYFQLFEHNIWKNSAR